MYKDRSVTALVTPIGVKAEEVVLVSLVPAELTAETLKA
tara:strand:+ start:89 stop:205 length:117 start_codon:yes stop_codon:yes gene_type:complete